MGLGESAEFPTGVKEVVAMFAEATPMPARCYWRGRAFAGARSKQSGVPGVISGKFSVRKIATKSPSVARHDYIPKKQDVVLYVTSHAELDVTVLDSKTGSGTSVYRPS